MVSVFYCGFLDSSPKMEATRLWYITTKLHGTATKKITIKNNYFLHQTLYLGCYCEVLQLTAMLAVSAV
jgi:hypothetical protein